MASVHEQVTLRQVRTMRQFLLIAMSFAAVFSVGHFIVWRVTGDVAFGRVSLLVALYTFVVALAFRGLRMGRVQGPAQLIAYGLLLLVGVGGYLLPLGVTAAVIGCIVAVAVALPFVRGTRLAVLAWTAAGTTAVLTLVNVLTPTPVYPGWVNAYAAVLLTIAFAFLVVWLLYVFATGKGRLLVEASSARDEAMRAHAHSELLAEASRRLLTEFDLGASLRVLTSLAVPSLGDFCLVEEAAVGGASYRAAVHRDPSKQALVGRALSRLACAAAARTSGCQDGEVPPAPRLLQGPALLALPGSPAACAALRALEPTALFVVPLRARGRELGTLLLGRSAPRPMPAPDEVALVEELGRRAALALDNVRLYRQMSDAVHARDEFLVVAAHELKTPLTPLKLNLSLMTQRLTALPPGRDRAWFDRHVQATLRQVDRLGRVIDELLEVSSAEPSGRAPVLGPVSWREVARTLLADLKASGDLERTASSLTLSTRGAVVGRWDAHRLRRITEHLVLNALKFGEGRPVSVRLESVGDEAVLTVEDRGMGIAEQDHTRVFGRFERAVSARHFGGLGLGLFLVQQAVDALGGAIELESNVGKGSRFRVRLPLAGPPGARGLDLHAGPEVGGPVVDPGAVAMQRVDRSLPEAGGDEPHAQEGARPDGAERESPYAAADPTPPSQVP